MENGQEDYVYQFKHLMKVSIFSHNQTTFIRFSEFHIRCLPGPGNKGMFCNNNEIETLISKRLSVENKPRLYQITRADFVKLHINLTAIMCKEFICYPSKMSDLGLTEKVKDNPCKFEVWLQGRNEVYVIQVLNQNRLDQI